jgi:MerR family transcriptional regulator, light-induced transcriptional regulator
MHINSFWPIVNFFVLDNVNTSLNIGAVERDTGLSKDTLRMWERRYAFPAPTRDSHGERLYPVRQVEKLRLIKQLMERGHRPGKIVGRSIEDLMALGSPRSTTQFPREDLEMFLKLIKAHELADLRSRLTQELARVGLRNFVVNTIAPLNVAVGDAWMEGRFAVFEEHLYSELIQNLLRNAIAAIQPHGGTPRVLLTSLPNETHGIGLLMAEALLCIEGAYCIPLGTSTPAEEIVAATHAHRTDVVALSFSASFPEGKATEALRQVRERLPAAVQLWAGGTGASRLRRLPEGVQLVSDFEHMVDLVKRWKEPQAFK